LSEKEIIVSFGADISDFKKAMNGVEKELKGVSSEVGNAMDDVQKEVKSSAGGIKSSLKGIGAAIAAAFAVDAIIDFGKTMLETTADIEALESQYSQVMGGMKDDTDKYLDEMSAKWNKHPNELKSAYMQYVAILKSKGVAEKEAHEIAKTTLDRTVDANAFANESMEETTGRFMAGIKGEYDSLDTAMVNLSATMLNDKAVEKYGKKFDELSVAQQEQMKVQEMVRQHTSAGVVGQGEREANSYQNSLAMLKNTWNELLAGFGSPILAWVGEKLASLTDLLNNVDIEGVKSSFATFGEYMGSVFGPIIDGIRSNFSEFMTFLQESGGLEAFKEAWAGIQEAFQWFLETLPQVTESLGSFIDKFDFLIAGILGGVAAYRTMIAIQAAYIAIMGLGITVTGVMTTVTTALGAVMAFVTSPIFLVAAAIAALIAIGILLYKNWDTISAWFKQMWESIKQKMASTLVSMASKWQDFKAKISAVWNAVRTLVSDRIDSIIEKVRSMIDSVTGIAGKIKSAVGGMFEGIKTPHFKFSGSLNPLKWPTQGMPKINVDWYATGGIATGPSVVGIGEAGDEAIVPLSNKSRMRPFAEAVAKMMPQAGGNGGDTVNFAGLFDGAIFNVRSEEDIRRIAREIKQLQDDAKLRKGFRT
jgi:hypothetical protein